jgi:hypothetical protein
LGFFRPADPNEPLALRVIPSLDGSAMWLVSGIPVFQQQGL